MPDSFRMAPATWLAVPVKGRGEAGEEIHIAVLAHMLGGERCVFGLRWGLNTHLPISTESAASSGLAVVRRVSGCRPCPWCARRGRRRSPTVSSHCEVSFRAPAKVALRLRPRSSPDHPALTLPPSVALGWPRAVEVAGVVGGEVVQPAKPSEPYLADDAPRSTSIRFEHVHAHVVTSKCIATEHIAAEQANAVHHHQHAIAAQATDADAGVCRRARCCWPRR